MAFLDLAAMSGALKELYQGQPVEWLVYKNRPLFGLMPKSTDFLGKYFPQPIVTGFGQGRSATFANAQGNQTAEQIQEFLVTRKHDYAIGTIDNETMLASQTDEGAFLRGAKTVIDGKFYAILQSFASGMFRAGTGTLGQINGSGLSTGVITLANPDDVVQFEYGQTLQCAATDGGTPVAALGYVIAVDRMAGTVTVSATGQGGAAGSPSGWNASYYLLAQGDSNAKVSGLQSWLPATVSASDNFYGVNRSQDRTRLAGIYKDFSDRSIEEALVDITQLAGREGAMIDHCFLNYTSYAALLKGLGTRKVITYSKAVNGDGTEAVVGFKGVEIEGANSTIKVFPDMYCPAGQAFMLELDTWKLRSLGDAPQILKYMDGNEFLRVGSSDAAEIRVGYYANVVCSAPGHNARVLLAQ